MVNLTMHSPYGAKFDRQLIYVKLMGIVTVT
jgi:hypothetical protein